MSGVRHLALPQKRQHALIAVAAVDPLEASRIAIEPVQCRFAAVEAVQVVNPLPQAAVRLVFQELPVEVAIVVPFVPLAELPAHEEQLLARLGVHVAEQQPEVGEFLPRVAGHLRQQRAFAMTTSSCESGSTKFSENAYIMRKVALSWWYFRNRGSCRMYSSVSCIQPMSHL